MQTERSIMRFLLREEHSTVYVDIRTSYVCGFDQLWLAALALRAYFVRPNRLRSSTPTLQKNRPKQIARCKYG